VVEGGAKKGLEDAFVRFLGVGSAVGQGRPNNSEDVK